MPARILLVMLFSGLLASACSNQPSQLVVPVIPSVAAFEPRQIETAPEPVQDATSQAEPTTHDCLNGEFSPIGQIIAEEYEFTDYTEVVTWFCDGAEFEDILVALETESQTGTPAEELLQMLADGFSWEEIWQLTGLTN